MVAMILLRKFRKFIYHLKNKIALLFICSCVVASSTFVKIAVQIVTGTNAHSCGDCPQNRHHLLLMIQISQLETTTLNTTLVDWNSTRDAVDTAIHERRIVRSQQHVDWS